MNSFILYNNIVVHSHTLGFKEIRIKVFHYDRPTKILGCKSDYGELLLESFGISEGCILIWIHNYVTQNFVALMALTNLTFLILEVSRLVA